MISLISGGSRISQTDERGIVRLRAGRQAMLEGVGIPGVPLDLPLLLFSVCLILAVALSLLILTAFRSTFLLIQNTSAFVRMEIHSSVEDILSVYSIG